MKCAIQDARVAILLNQQAQVGILKICIVPILQCQAIYIFCIEHLEWRISFVLMEKTILQSLSHSQFMCYGLLKLYLKEILGSFEEINDIVSSYFMKTLLLWEIQTNSQHNGHKTFR
jgi:hypothetical protein